MIKFTKKTWAQTTRYNQLRFHNEVLINSDKIESNGLSTCKFREFGKETVDNIIHINVGIWNQN